MSQSRAGSVVESVSSTAIGFAVSFITWQLLGPSLGYAVTLYDNLVITSVFTVVSIIRGYYVRRLFNWIGRKGDAHR